MKKLIDLDAYEDFKTECLKDTNPYVFYCSGFEDGMERAGEWLDAQPTVDAVPVVHGRWEPHPNENGFDRCSVCRDCVIYADWADGKKWGYCPNCGAKMDGGENNE